MRIDVFTLFPEWFDWMRRPRHMTNAALSAGLELRCFSPRDTTPAVARPGRRLALRRRAGHGDPGGRDGRRARGGVRGARDGRARSAPRGGAHARAAARSPTRSPASWPPSPSWRCCAAATRASTSACTRCSPTTRSASGRSSWPAGRWPRWPSSTRSPGASTGALGNADSLHRGVVLGGSRRPHRAPALHPSRAVPRPPGARRPALGRPRGDRAVARGAHPGAPQVVALWAPGGGFRRIACYAPGRFAGP